MLSSAETWVRYLNFMPNSHCLQAANSCRGGSGVVNWALKRTGGCAPFLGLYINTPLITAVRWCWRGWYLWRRLVSSARGRRRSDDDRRCRCCRRRRTTTSATRRRTRRSCCGLCLARSPRSARGSDADSPAQSNYQSYWIFGSFAITYVYTSGNNFYGLLSTHGNVYTATRHGNCTIRHGTRYDRPWGIGLFATAQKLARLIWWTYGMQICNPGIESPSVPWFPDWRKAQYYQKAKKNCETERCKRSLVMLNACKSNCHCRGRTRPGDHVNL